jgi:diketogulonate reductase-like aldo/keto reductase
MGQDPANRRAEIEALRLGIEQGLMVIDTAEMYANGGAEEVVAEAIRGVSEQVFVVSKVWPSHAQYDQVLNALNQSLKRLRRDYVDLYLLHWPSRSVPLAETLRALHTAQREGKARYVGVSNFPAGLLDEARHAAESENLIAVDQVEYHLGNRRAEYRLIPYCEQHHLALMAYSPIKGLYRLPATHPGWQTLKTLAQARGVPQETIALAYLIQSGPVLAIPKAVAPDHVLANRKALDLELTSSEIQQLHEAFPMPQEDIPLQAM